MGNHITHTPGTYEEVSVRCPNCNSKQISVKIDSKGYFHIYKCEKCGYSEE